MGRLRRGDRYSEATSSCLPELSGRLDEATAARVRHLVEDPSTTAVDIQRFRAEYAAERARRKAAAAQLDRDLLVLAEALQELPGRSQRR